MGIFKTLKGSSTVPSPILWNFKMIQDLIVVLVTCKNEEDPIKNEGASLRVVRTLYLNISDSRGQLTP